MIKKPKSWLSFNIIFKNGVPKQNITSIVKKTLLKCRIIEKKNFQKILNLNLKLNI